MERSASPGVTRNLRILLPMTSNADFLRVASVFESSLEFDPQFGESRRR